MYLTSSIFNRDLSGRGSGMSPEAVNIQFLLLHKTRRITVRRWGYATHSPSACFNGGVKVKRQPWNVLSLTFLQLRLCNINVIVCQRGRRQRVNQPFYSTMQEDITTFFIIVMLQHRILSPSCSYFKCHQSTSYIHTSKSRVFMSFHTKCGVWTPSRPFISSSRWIQRAIALSYCIY